MTLSLRYCEYTLPSWSWNNIPGRRSGMTLWTIWKGKGKLITEASQYELKSGDFFLLDLTKAIQGSQDTDDPLYMRYIDILPPVPAFVTDCPEYSQIDDLIFMDKLFCRIRDSLSHKDDQGAASIWYKAIIQEIDDSQNRRNPGNSKNDICIDEICLEISCNPLKYYSISELAGKAGFSTDHFIRLFKSKMKMTPYQFLLESKINFSKNLLRNTNNSIGEIATILGYSDLYTFSRQFKEKTGMPPSDYRGK